MSKDKFNEIISTCISCSKDTIKYFSQINFNSTTCISSHLMNDYIIDGHTYTIKLQSSKFIDTIEGTSIEGQHLTGKKLLIIGAIFINVIFVSKYTSCKNTVFKINIPFSTYIVVPKDICDKDIVNIGYLVEDITIIKLSEKNLFTTVTLLLQYQDKFI